MWHWSMGNHWLQHWQPENHDFLSSSGPQLPLTPLKEASWVVLLLHWMFTGPRPVWVPVGSLSSCDLMSVMWLHECHDCTMSVRQFFRTPSLPFVSCSFWPSSFMLPKTWSCHPSYIKSGDLYIYMHHIRRNTEGMETLQLDKVTSMSLISSCVLSWKHN